MGLGAIVQLLFEIFVCEREGQSSRRDDNTEIEFGGRSVREDNTLLTDATKTVLGVCSTGSCRGSPQATPRRSISLLKIEVRRSGKYLFIADKTAGRKASNQSVQISLLVRSLISFLRVYFLAEKTENRSGYLLAIP